MSSKLARVNALSVAITQVEKTSKIVENVLGEKYIEGDITNNTGKNIEKGSLVFKLFNKGNKSGKTTAECERLRTGSTWHFQARFLPEEGDAFLLDTISGW